MYAYTLMHVYICFLMGVTCWLLQWPASYQHHIGLMAIIAIISIILAMVV